MDHNTDQLITPDFSGIQDRVGPGIYKARITAYKIDKWEGKDGKPSTKFVNWTLETFGEEQDKNNGRRIFHKTPVEGGGAFRLQDFYRAAMGEDLASGKPFDPAMLQGRELEVTYAQQTNNPEYNEVKSVRAIKHS